MRTFVHLAALIAAIALGLAAGWALARDTIEIRVAGQHLKAVETLTMQDHLSVGFSRPMRLDLLCGRATLKDVRDVRVRGGRLLVTRSAGAPRSVAAINCVARLRGRDTE